MRRNRSPDQMNVKGLPRRRRDANPQPVPTFQPDPKTSPPPQPQAGDEDEAIVAAINRMVEAAYT